MICINGRQQAELTAMNLAELLKRLGREASRTAVMVDGKFIAAADYRKFPVPDGAGVQVWEFQDGG